MRNDTRLSRMLHVLIHMGRHEERATSETIAQMLGTADGHSLHADFWNTWDQDALEGLVRGCLLSGQSCASTTNSNFSQRVA